jgi:hypothetical protein
MINIMTLQWSRTAIFLSTKSGPSKNTVCRTGSINTKTSLFFSLTIPDENLPVHLHMEGDFAADTPGS